LNFGTTTAKVMCSNIEHNNVQINKWLLLFCCLIKTSKISTYRKK
jgi:hypothetical protein